MTVKVDAMRATMAVDPATMAAEAELFAEGTVLAGRYLLESALGEGGMGAVYRALDRELEEYVALKVLRTEIASDPSAVERFVREVKLARRVTHPNVARTYDLGATADGRRFLTMELIEGPSLGVLVERGPVALPDALRLVADVARGLMAAHAVGVVHRDLKPDNVLLSGASREGPLTGTERVVITDFGIARLTDREGTEEKSKSQRGKALTTGGVVGTPAYMAPEQVVGETPDGRSDVFALGVLLFELLTGRLPFEGQTAMELATARLTRSAPDVRESDANVPEGVAALLASMLSRAREERPDASSVLEQLDVLRGVTRATPANPAAVFGPVPGTTTLAFEGEKGAQRWNNVAVLPFSSAEPTLERYARELGGTLADALSRIRVLRVVPPAVLSEGAELASLARTHKVDLVLGGSLRREGDRVRANLRLIDPAQGSLKWGERFEGMAGGLFALEDQLARGVELALRGLAEGDARRERGPADPTARALFERALECSRRMNELAPLEEGLALARRALEHAAGDASVMSLLAFLLVRVALLKPDERGLLVEAEEWALRALNADGSLGLTYTALGLLRLHQGDLRASVRAFREALVRDPKDAEAVAYLGRFLVESGYLEDGVRRLEFALRLEPNTQHAWWNLARVRALLNEWERAEKTLEEAVAATGNLASALVVGARLALWREDGDMADRIAAKIDKTPLPQGHFVRNFMPVLRAHAERTLSERTSEPLRENARRATSPSMRAFWVQVIAELHGSLHQAEPTLDAIEELSGLVFLDVGWMDHCPALAFVRGAGRFGRARAIVGARAQALWK